MICTYISLILLIILILYFIFCKDNIIYLYNPIKVLKDYHIPSDGSNLSCFYFIIKSLFRRTNLLVSCGGYILGIVSIVKFNLYIIIVLFLIYLIYSLINEFREIYHEWKIISNCNIEQEIINLKEEKLYDAFRYESMLYDLKQIKTNVLYDEVKFKVMSLEKIINKINKNENNFENVHPCVNIESYIFFNRNKNPDPK